MQIQITTDAKTDARGLALLKQIGLPFKKAIAKKGAVEKKA